jgi:hypothetical protein
MPVVAPVERRRQLVRWPHVGVAVEHVGDLVGILLVNAGERQLRGSTQPEFRSRGNPLRGTGQEKESQRQDHAAMIGHSRVECATACGVEGWRETVHPAIIIAMRLASRIRALGHLEAQGSKVLKTTIGELCSRGEGGA